MTPATFEEFEQQLRNNPRAVREIATAYLAKNDLNRKQLLQLVAVPDITSLRISLNNLILAGLKRIGGNTVNLEERSSNVKASQKAENKPHPKIKGDGAQTYVNPALQSDEAFIKDLLDPQNKEKLVLTLAARPRPGAPAPKPEVENELRMKYESPRPRPR